MHKLVGREKVEGLKTTMVHQVASYWASYPSISCAWVAHCTGSTLGKPGNANKVHFSDGGHIGKTYLTRFTEAHLQQVENNVTVLFCFDLTKSHC